MKGSCNNAQLYTTGTRGLLAIFGLTVALFGSRPLELPVQADNVLVSVNQHAVTSEQLDFAVQRLSNASAHNLSAEQRQSILKLLVDEELLLQRAETLGLYGADPGIRKAIVQAAIDQVVADFLANSVDIQQLRLFYRQHQAVFERPKRVAVQALRLANLPDAERTQVALSAGAGFAELGNSADNGILSHLPSSPLPVHMLRRYLGSALTDIALTLDQGEVSDPIHRSDGVYLLQARIVEPAVVPDFDEVRAEVEAEYRRRGRDKALEKTLVTLWEKADIDFNPTVKGDLVLAGEGRPGSSELLNTRTGYEDTY